MSNKKNFGKNPEYIKSKQPKMTPAEKEARALQGLIYGGVDKIPKGNKILKAKRKSGKWDRRKA